MQEIKGFEIGMSMNDWDLGFNINLWSTSDFPYVIFINIGPLYICINRLKYWKAYLK